MVLELNLNLILNDVKIYVANGFLKCMGGLLVILDL